MAITKPPSSMVTYDQGGTGSVERTLESRLQDSVSVFDYMTSAEIADVQAETGAVDVTTAINTALTALPSGGTLYFPFGRYAVTTLTLPNKFIHLRGDGRGLRTGTRITSASGSICIDTGSSQLAKHSSLTGISVLAASATSTGILARSNAFHIYDAIIEGGLIGMEIQYAVAATYKNLTVNATQTSGTTYGIHINPTMSQVVNVCTFTNVAASSGSISNGTALQIDGTVSARGNTFIGLDLETANVGLYSNGYLSVFINLWEENCTTGITDTDASLSVFINRTAGDGTTFGANSVFLSENPYLPGYILFGDDRDLLSDVVSIASGSIRGLGSSGKAGLYLMDDDGSTYAAGSGPRGVTYMGRVNTTSTERAQFVRDTGVKFNGDAGDLTGQFIRRVSESDGTMTAVEQRTVLREQKRGVMYFSNNPLTKDAFGMTGNFKTISGSTTSDALSVDMVDEYGTAIISVEFTAVSTSNASVYAVVKRHVNLNNGSPSFTTIGSDALLNCTVTFVYVSGNKIKMTITNSLSQSIFGAISVTVTGAGDPAQSNAGITDLLLL